MDTTRFDRWTRFVSTASSRRQTLASLLLGAIAARFATEEAAAGPGCKNVGKKCQKAKECCSGVCKGKKGKKKCKAHDSGGCQAGEQTGICGGASLECTSSAGNDGFCQTTTGNGGYCAVGGLVCRDCQKDADCRDVCGAGAACIRCGLVGCETACVGPQDCE